MSTRTHAETKPDLSERMLAMAFESCGPPPGTGTMFQVDLARRMTVEDLFPREVRTMARV